MAADKLEYYNTDDDIWTSVSGAFWDAQSFTPSVSLTVSFVKLKLFRYLVPAVVAVSIKATDEDGKPTGDDLVSGTIDENTITQDSDGAWYEITFSNAVTLTAGTKYAIVCKVLDGDVTHYIAWRFDNNDATYSGGDRIHSVDSGVNWGVQSNDDFMFELWGRGIGGTAHWPAPRYEDYDETQTFDQATETWVDTFDVVGGGRYNQQLVVVGQNDTGQGVVYYG